MVFLVFLFVLLMVSVLSFVTLGIVAFVTTWSSIGVMQTLLVGIALGLTGSIILLIFVMLVTN